MNKQELKPQRNYKKIYLFSSLVNYGEERENKLNGIKFNDDDCIVLFNNPNSYVKKLFKNKKINYIFCRGFNHHLTSTIKMLKNNTFDMTNTEIIHECINSNDEYYFKQFSNFNLRYGINIKNNKLDSLEYFKNLGYIADRPRHYSPSMGFKAIIILNLLYPDTIFYLIGFEDVINKKIKCHNYKFENEYLKQSNIKYLHI